jgi:hypothetical protein
MANPISVPKKLQLKLSSGRAVSAGQSMPVVACPQDAGGNKDGYRRSTTDATSEKRGIIFMKKLCYLPIGSQVQNKPKPVR